MTSRSAIASADNKRHRQIKRDILETILLNDNIAINLIITVIIYPTKLINNLYALKLCGLI